MRKLISAILVLVMLACCSALAEANWVMYNFGDFTLTFPEDIVCAYSEERAENQPFLVFYQDYQEGASFVKNLNVVWNSGVDDISALDPAAIGEMILNGLVAQMEATNVPVTNAALVSAESLEFGGKPAIGIAYSLTADYSALENGQVLNMVFMQMMFSDEAFGTYNFTLTTDDLENTETLVTILDSISWNV